MSDDLVKRLRKADEYKPLGHDGWEAADRIEELEVECNKAALWAREQHASADRYAARIKELEAKLAKAVMALQLIEQFTNTHDQRAVADEALAELKGQDDA